MDIDHSIASPNHSSRNGARIQMLVIHATAGSRRGDIATLTDPHAGDPRVGTAQDPRVSIHYYITKDNHIYQMVDDNEAAWHAGRSSWRGMDSYAIQVGSVGIELENANTGLDPYPQFNTALELSGYLVTKYQIPMDNVVRHLDIAPGRKTDPAGFAWSQFKSGLVWSQWGADYPLPASQRGYGIPSAWYRGNGPAVLGRAISFPTYHDFESASGTRQLVVQFFERGCIWGVEPGAQWTVSVGKTL